jgi:hypothetical protein
MTLTSLMPGGRRSPSPALLLLVLLAAGCGKKDTLATLERVPLPAPASPAATLSIDSLGRAWVGDSARLVALDSSGRQLARVPVELKGAPRLLWLDSARLVLRVSGAAAIVDAAGKTAALRGRPLTAYRPPAPARRLEPPPDGTLYALVGGDVVALRHGRAGLGPLWHRGFGGIGQADADELRVSPSGERIAVLARGKELRLLSAADGKVLQEGMQSPRDVAWDAAGRLWVLGEREIRIVR